ncbi:helix-turn-helix transcriptional regulator [Chelativorans sp. YIM 93263]|uniref:helix-turn-helix transcriptional regulator n=1 Tax=Chelativorans sp. YIM 93263 TaxID=2906648 RepID=UPI0023784756|nr:helix-turn-helix transcriptional regulator [Chelativorans sp. YIM 93263]
MRQTGPAGLALPIAAGEAGLGVAIFTGTRMRLDEDALLGIHAGCHALFSKLPEVTPEREESALPAMSRRELQCLKLTANGLTSDDIAEELGLSVHTANQYLANAAQKLNATNRIHAVAKALREGLID